MELRDSILSVLARSEGDVGVAVENLKTGETVFVNEGMVFPSASTIKLVVLSQLMKETEEGRRRLQDVLELRDEAKVGGDGILKELDAGHRFTLRELAALMIVLSDNTAANILIDLMGMEAVNRRAAEMDLGRTRLQRRMMDAEARKAGRENFTSAADMHRFLKATYEGRNVSPDKSARMLEILKRQQVTGRLDLYLPLDDEGIVLAHKTGDLERLEHDVGIVYLRKCEYIVCVLTKETKTNKDGREIIGSISRAVYDAYK